MICVKCKKEIEDGAKRCSFCGASQEAKTASAPNVIEINPVSDKKDEKVKTQKAEKQEKKAEKKSESATLLEPKKENKPEKAEKEPKAKKEKSPKTKKEIAPAEEKPRKKSKDRVNFFLLILSLCCPPYFGVLITVCTSAKAPKASQVYGVFTILSFIFSKIKNYVLTVIATVCVVIGVIAVVLQGAYIVIGELGYDISSIISQIPVLS